MTTFLELNPMIELKIRRCAMEFINDRRQCLDFREECDHILGRGMAHSMSINLQQIWDEAMAFAIEHLGAAKEVEDKNRLINARKALRRIKPPLWKRVHHE